jgi:hypothetical protein
MTEKKDQPDYIGNIIVFILLALIILAGVIAYKSINWKILDDLEKQEFVLPTPAPATPSAQLSPATNSATPSSTQN